MVSYLLLTIFILAEVVKVKIAHEAQTSLEVLKPEENVDKQLLQIQAKRTEIGCKNEGIKTLSLFPNRYFICRKFQDGLYLEYRQCLPLTHTFYEILQQCQPTIGGGVVTCVIPEKKCTNNTIGAIPFPNFTKLKHYLVCLPSAIHICKCINYEIFDDKLGRCRKQRHPTFVKRDDSKGEVPPIFCTKNGINKIIYINKPYPNKCVLICRAKFEANTYSKYYYLLNIICTIKTEDSFPRTDTSADALLPSWYFSTDHTDISEKTDSESTTFKMKKETTIGIEVTETNLSDIVESDARTETEDSFTTTDTARTDTKTTRSDASTETEASFTATDTSSDALLSLGYFATRHTDISESKESKTTTPIDLKNEPTIGEEITQTAVSDIEESDSQTETEASFTKTGTSADALLSTGYFATDHTDITESIQSKTTTPIDLTNAPTIGEEITQTAVSDIEGSFAPTETEASFTKTGTSADALLSTGYFATDHTDITESIQSKTTPPIDLTNAPTIGEEITQTAVSDIEGSVAPTETEALFTKTGTSADALLSTGYFATDHTDITESIQSKTTPPIDLTNAPTIGEEITQTAVSDIEGSFAPTETEASFTTTGTSANALLSTGYFATDHTGITESIESKTTTQIELTNGTTIAEELTQTGVSEVEENNALTENEASFTTTGTSADALLSTGYFATEHTGITESTEANTTTTFVLTNGITIGEEITQTGVSEIEESYAPTETEASFTTTGTSADALLSTGYFATDHTDISESTEANTTTTFVLTNGTTIGEEITQTGVSEIEESYAPTETEDSFRTTGTSAVELLSSEDPGIDHTDISESTESNTTTTFVLTNGITIGEEITQTGVSENEESDAPTEIGASFTTTGTSTHALLPTGYYGTDHTDVSESTEANTTTTFVLTNGTTIGEEITETEVSDIEERNAPTETEALFSTTGTSADALLSTGYFATEDTGITESTESKTTTTIELTNEPTIGEEITQTGVSEIEESYAPTETEDSFGTTGISADELLSSEFFAIGHTDVSESTEANTTTTFVLTNGTTIGEEITQTAVSDIEESNSPTETEASFTTSGTSADALLSTGYFATEHTGITESTESKTTTTIELTNEPTIGEEITQTDVSEIEESNSPRETEDSFRTTGISAAERLSSEFLAIDHTDVSESTEGNTTTTFVLTNGITIGEEITQTGVSEIEESYAPTETKDSFGTTGISADELLSSEFLAIDHTDVSESTEGNTTTTFVLTNGTTIGEEITETGVSEIEESYAPTETEDSFGTTGISADELLSSEFFAIGHTDVSESTEANTTTTFVLTNGITIGEEITQTAVSDIEESNAPTETEASFTTTGTSADALLSTGYFATEHTGITESTESKTTTTIELTNEPTIGEEITQTGVSEIEESYAPTETEDSFGTTGISADELLSSEFLAIDHTDVSESTEANTTTTFVLTNGTTIGEEITKTAESDIEECDAPTKTGASFTTTGTSADALLSTGYFATKHTDITENIERNTTATFVLTNGITIGEEITQTAVSDIEGSNAPTETEASFTTTGTSADALLSTGYFATEHTGITESIENKTTTAIELTNEPTIGEEITQTEVSEIEESDAPTETEASFTTTGTSADALLSTGYFATEHTGITESTEANTTTTFVLTNGTTIGEEITQTGVSEIEESYAPTETEDSFGTTGISADELLSSEFFAIDHTDVSESTEANTTTTFVLTNGTTIGEEITETAVSDIEERNAPTETEASFTTTGTSADALLSTGYFATEHTGITESTEANTTTTFVLTNGTTIGEEITQTAVSDIEESNAPTETEASFTTTGTSADALLSTGYFATEHTGITESTEANTTTTFELINGTTIATELTQTGASEIEESDVPTEIEASFTTTGTSSHALLPTGYFATDHTGISESTESKTTTTIELTNEPTIGEEITQTGVSEIEESYAPTETEDSFGTTGISADELLSSEFLAIDHTDVSESTEGNTTTTFVLTNGITIGEEITQTAVSNIEGSNAPTETDTSFTTTGTSADALLSTGYFATKHTDITESIERNTTATFVLTNGIRIGEEITQTAVSDIEESDAPTETEASFTTTGTSDDALLSTGYFATEHTGITESTEGKTTTTIELTNEPTIGEEITQTGVSETEESYAPTETEDSFGTTGISADELLSSEFLAIDHTDVSESTEGNTTTTFVLTNGTTIGEEITETAVSDIEERNAPTETEASFTTTGTSADALLPTGYFATDHTDISESTESKTTTTIELTNEPTIGEEITQTAVSDIEESNAPTETEASFTTIGISSDALLSTGYFATDHTGITESIESKTTTPIDLTNEPTIGEEITQTAVSDIEESNAPTETEASFTTTGTSADALLSTGYFATEHTGITESTESKTTTTIELTNEPTIGEEITQTGVSEIEESYAPTETEDSFRTTGISADELLSSEFLAIDHTDIFESTESNTTTTIELTNEPTIGEEITETAVSDIEERDAPTETEASFTTTGTSADALLPTGYFATDHTDISESTESKTTTTIELTNEPTIGEEITQTGSSEIEESDAPTETEASFTTTGTSADALLSTRYFATDHTDISERTESQTITTFELTNEPTIGKEITQTGASEIEESDVPTETEASFTTTGTSSHALLPTGYFATNHTDISESTESKMTTTIQLTNEPTIGEEITQTGVSEIEESDAPTETEDSFRTTGISADELLSSEFLAIDHTDISESTESNTTTTFVLTNGTNIGEEITQTAASDIEESNAPTETEASFTTTGTSADALLSTGYFATDHTGITESTESKTTTTIELTNEPTIGEEITQTEVSEIEESDAPIEAEASFTTTGTSADALVSTKYFVTDHTDISECTESKTTTTFVLTNGTTNGEEITQTVVSDIEKSDAPIKTEASFTTTGTSADALLSTGYVATDHTGINESIERKTTTPIDLTNEPTIGEKITQTEVSEIEESDAPIEAEASFTTTGTSADALVSTKYFVTDHTDISESTESKTTTTFVLTNGTTIGEEITQTAASDIEESDAPIETEASFTTTGTSADALLSTRYFATDHTDISERTESQTITTFELINGTTIATELTQTGASEIEESDAPIKTEASFTTTGTSADALLSTGYFATDHTDISESTESKTTTPSR
ncbi:hypothetical protein FQA39_LY09905 [Lamprigera yunnana]|nr:hypothetical protein FQA39_LY09905 [Lamprigera yunnana]